MLISSPSTHQLTPQKKATLTTSSISWEIQTPSFTEHTVYILLFSNSCPPCVFSNPVHTYYGSCRTRAPPSLALSLSLSGLWRRESLLRILALLHHNTHDVSTFHTHFLPTTIKKLSAHAWQQTRTPRCTGERRELDPSVPPPSTTTTTNLLALQKSCAVFFFLCHLI